MAKVGRNELCPCGSGKKYKQCCERKARQVGVGTRIALIALAGAIAAAVLFGIVSRDESAGPNRVWSPEHGHYHDHP